MAGEGKKVVTVRCSVELFEAIEAARGQVPREVWARDAFQLKLNGGQMRMPMPVQRNIGPRQPRGEVHQRGDKK